MADFKRSYNIEQLQVLLDEELQCLIGKKHHFCVKTKNGGFFVNFKYCNINFPFEKQEQVYFYCDNQRLLMVSDSEQCQKILEDISQEDSPYLQLISFFNALIIDDIDVFNHLEDHITMLEDELLNSKKPLNFTIAQVVRQRRKILKIKQYYERLDVIIDVFMENMDIETVSLLEHRYQILVRRIEQYLNIIRNLQDLVMQVREVYQSQVDMQQNKLMKIFTIITTIFTPLTLITGWYGMNFNNMPELEWKLGYLYVIGLSLFVSLVGVVVFKVKGWFK